VPDSRAKKKKKKTVKRKNERRCAQELERPIDRDGTEEAAACNGPSGQVYMEKG
jgi:hypothetical protein